MTKKSPYPYSPGTPMWACLKNAKPEERIAFLTENWTVDRALELNEFYDKINKTKILQEKVKAEIEKTFNWVTSFSHIKALYKLMWEYPDWDMTKIKLKPNCIEFEVETWEIIKLSVADLPGKLTPLTAFEEAKKFNLYIPEIEEWGKLISLMPWNDINEMSKNLKKLCNLKDWKYLTPSWLWWEKWELLLEEWKLLAPNFKKGFFMYLCNKEEVINVRGAIKQN